MKSFVVSKDLLGTASSLRIDGKSLKKVKESEDDTVIGSSSCMPWSMESLFSVWEMPVPDIVSPAMRASYESVHGPYVDWSRALGRDRFVKHLKGLVKEVEERFSRIGESPYPSILAEGRKTLARLQPSLVNRERVDELLKEGESGVLRSFLPEEGSHLPITRYSHATATGRLTVQTGPKILSLNKQHRNVLTSRFRKGKIAMIDFVSLEPRTALLLTRKTAPRDIYEEMGKETSSSLSRAKLKVATISSLYGSGHSDPATMAAVGKFFGVREIQERYLTGDRITNLYGRPLAPEESRLRLPYFVQSTSVDVALMGFGKVLRSYLEVVPLFVIHDALVVDIERDLYDELSRSGIEVDIDPLGKYYLSVQSVEESI